MKDYVGKVPRQICPSRICDPSNHQYGFSKHNIARIRAPAADGLT